MEQFLRTTRTAAFLVIRRCVLENELYRPGVTALTPLSSWSVAKSIVSLLVGQAIGNGTLHEADRLSDVRFGALATRL